MSPGRRALAVAAIVVALLPLAGCGGPAPNEVDMGVVTFEQAKVTINAGQSVRFVDSAQSGGLHVLCIGQGLSCIPKAGAPAELNTASGITFSAGDPPRDIVFPNAGTYQIVCTIHPNMVLTVVVR